MKQYAAFLIMFLTAAALYAENDAPAVLAKGPIPHEGIEYLGVNVIPNEYAEYNFNGDVITIYFTYEQIFLSDSWTASMCDIAGLQRLSSPPDEDRSILVYSDKKGWYAFFSFPETADYICGFISEYRNRQNYFINIARDKDLFSFPAILNIE